MSTAGSRQAGFGARCAAGAHAVLVAVALGGAAAAQTAEPEASALPAHAAHAPIRIEYRSSAFVDQFFYVRRFGEAPDPPGEDASQQAAVAAARALQAELGSPLAWGPIEGLLGGCASAQDALAKFRELPESFELRGGRSVRLREGAIALGEALLAAEPEFRAKVWPEHEAAIEAAREKIDADFVPKEAACYTRLARDLGFDDVELTIPVFLVAEGPFPGAVTQRDDADRGVCFVSVGETNGTLLFETILHETIHALDLATRTSALEELRAKLRSAGIGPSHRELRDVPHTLMFVEAAGVIRREVDPQHVDYGDAAGYYAKVPSATIVREAWTAHLEGRTSREAALAKMADKVAAQREAK